MTQAWAAPPARASRSSPRSTTRRWTRSRTPWHRCSARTFDDWEWVLVDDCSTDAEVRVRLAELAERTLAVRVHEREVNGGIVAASQRRAAAGASASSSACSTTTTCWPEALAGVARGDRRHPDVDYVYSDQDRMTVEGETHSVPQARLVARAAAAPHVHHPLLGAAPVAGTRGRRVPRRLRRIPGPRPGAARHRAGPRGRAHPRGALPLARGPGLGRWRRRGQAVGVGRRRPRGPGPPRPDRHPRYGEQGPVAWHLPRRARAGPGPPRSASSSRPSVPRAWCAAHDAAMVVETVRSRAGVLAPPGPGVRRRLRLPDSAVGPGRAARPARSATRGFTGGVPRTRSTSARRTMWAPSRHRRGPDFPQRRHGGDLAPASSRT